MSVSAKAVASLIVLLAASATQADEPVHRPVPPMPTVGAVQKARLEQEQQQALKENALIGQANQAVSAKDWPKAESLFQQLIQLAPDRWQYRRGLADAQLSQGKYADAQAAYATALDQASKDSSDPEKLRGARAVMYTNEGNAYLKMKQTDAAIAAYSQAAALDPHPATAYFNLCATQYNAGNVEGALAACDKAIAADPAKADAYFIKGSLLVGDAKAGPNGTYTVPPGTVEALQMYLKLAPQGPHATDVQQMLDFINGKTP